MFDYNFAWGIVKFASIMLWFLKAGIVSLFLLRFKPTRKLIGKYFPLLTKKESV